MKLFPLVDFKNNLLCVYVSASMPVYHILLVPMETRRGHPIPRTSLLLFVNFHIDAGNGN